jgi:hypothetical protein
MGPFTLMKNAWGVILTGSPCQIMIQYAEELTRQQPDYIKRVLSLAREFHNYWMLQLLMVHPWPQSRDTQTQPDINFNTSFRHVIQPPIDPVVVLYTDSSLYSIVVEQ